MAVRTEQELFDKMVNAMRSDEGLGGSLQRGDINGFVKDAASALIRNTGELIPDGHAATVQTRGVETDSSLQVLPILSVIIDGMPFILDMVSGEEGYLGPEAEAPERYKDSVEYDLRDEMNQKLVNDEG